MALLLLVLGACVLANFATAMMMPPHRMSMPRRWGTFGSEHLPSVINTICEAAGSNEAEENSQHKDACYGCFLRLSNRAQCNDTQDKFAICASKYLQGSPFESCAGQLAMDSIEEGYNSTQNNDTICDFEKCVREMDMMNMVRECASEVADGVDEVTKYMNMTSCILGRLVCKEKMKAKLPWQAYGPMPLKSLIVTQDMKLVAVDGGWWPEMRCGSRFDAPMPMNQAQAAWQQCECSS